MGFVVAWGKLGGAAISAILVGGVVIACSGSDSGSSSSSVDSSKIIGDLSDAEDDQLCREAVDYAASQLTADDRKRIACVLVAGLATAFASPKTTDEAKQKCQASWDQCLSAPPEGGDAGPGGDAGGESQCDKAALQSCKGVTVGEFRACLQDNVTLTKSELAKNPCDSVQLVDGHVQFDQTAPPASCQSILSKCPGIFDSFDGAPAG